MNPPGLIIFDIDGTLFQAHTVTVPAVQRTLEARGIPAPAPEAILAFTGRPVEQYYAWLARLCPGCDAQAVIAEADALELRLIREEGRLYDGVDEMLRRLKAEGFALAACSNGPDDYVNEALDAHGLRPYFDALRWRGTRYDGKPAMMGEILAEISARPGVVVGDRNDDIESAHRHGLRAIGAAYGYGAEDELAAADARVNSVAEIIPAIRRLLAIKV